MSIFYASAKKFINIHSGICFFFPQCSAYSLAKPPMKALLERTTVGGGEHDSDKKDNQSCDLSLSAFFFFFVKLSRSYLPPTTVAHHPCRSSPPTLPPPPPHHHHRRSYRPLLLWVYSQHAHLSFTTTALVGCRCCGFTRNTHCCLPPLQSNAQENSTGRWRYVFNNSPPPPAPLSTHQDPLHLCCCRFTRNSGCSLPSPLLNTQL